MFMIMVMEALIIEFTCIRLVEFLKKKLISL